MQDFKKIRYRDILNKIQIPLKIFLLNRFLIILIIQAALLFFPLNGKYPAGNSYPGRIFLNGLIRWDAGWYASISTGGYDINSISKQNNNIAFMPLYPITIRFLSKTGLDVLSVGILLSNTSLLFSVILIYYLVNKHAGQVIAKKTILLFLYFPFSFYLSAMYAESFFLLLALLAFYFSEKEQWILAVICASLAGITREVGFLTAIAVFIFYLQSINYSLSKISFKAFQFLVGLVGPLSYVIYLTYRFGDPLVFLESHFSRGRLVNDYGLMQIIKNLRFLYPVQNIPEHLSAVLETTHLFLGLVSLTIVITSFKKIPLVYTLWGLGIILISFTAWFEFGRLLVVIFPIFYVLAIILENKYLFKGVLLFSFLLLYIFTTMFALGYWVA